MFRCQTQGYGEKEDCAYDEDWESMMCGFPVMAENGTLCQGGVFGRKKMFLTKYRLRYMLNEN